MFEKYSEISNQMPDLFVTGNACEDQTLEALKRYSHRPYFVQKALSHLFSITHVSIFFFINHNFCKSHITLIHLKIFLCCFFSKIKQRKYNELKNL